jgi:hypothetical protein
MSIFVSYSHRQYDWVHSRLIPVLRAAGAEVVVDTGRFEAGKTVIGQMDAHQSAASRHLLVITSDYLASDYCQHEMLQAIKSDPKFVTGRVLPVRLAPTPLPAPLAGSRGLGTGPLYVDLQDDKNSVAWKLLLKSCLLKLAGIDAPDWLNALDCTQTHLRRGESVNLVICNKDIDWRLWFEQFKQTRFDQIADIDLDDPRATPREGLIGEILRATKRSNAVVPPPPKDLPLLAALENGECSYLAIKHFDRVKFRDQYGLDFYSSLRWLVMDARKLVLLAFSVVPIADLLPRYHGLSPIDFKTVELG